MIPTSWAINDTVHHFTVYCICWSRLFLVICHLSILTFTRHLICFRPIKYLFISIHVNFRFFDFWFFIFYFLFFIFFIRPKFQPRTHKHHFLIFNFFQIFVFHSTQIPNPICTHSVILFILRFLQLTHHSTNSKRCSTMIFMFKILQ